jgi:hypothetical protein
VIEALGKTCQERPGAGGDEPQGARRAAERRGEAWRKIHRFAEINKIEEFMDFADSRNLLANLLWPSASLTAVNLPL